MKIQCIVVVPSTQKEDGSPKPEQTGDHAWWGKTMFSTTSTGAARGASLAISPPLNALKRP